MCKNPFTVAEIEELRERPSMTPEEFARAANVSARTVRRICERGDLKAVRVGSQWRINTHAALEYLGY